MTAAVPVLLLSLWVAKFVYCEYCDIDDGDFDARMTGGVASRKGESRFMCSYTHDVEGHKCGVTVLTKKWGLTSASCCEKMSKSRTSNVCLRCGRHCLDQSQSGSYTISAKNITTEVHEDYTEEKEGDDICLIEFHKRLTFNRDIDRVCLCKEKDHRERKVILVGWEWDSDVEEQDRQCLKELRMKVLKTDVCEGRMDERDLSLQRGQICASKNQEENACEGDSGGPLLAMSSSKSSREDRRSNKRRKIGQLGIVSMATLCDEPEKVSVFTNVGYYLDWIKDKMGADANDLCLVNCGKKEKRRKKRPITREETAEETEEVVGTVEETEYVEYDTGGPWAKWLVGEA